MIPIYEQGSGRGVGYNGKNFLNRFEEICLSHLEQKRAKAFAFIFYDFLDSDIKRILKDQGAFARLDRLSGDELSIFYIHSPHEAFVSDLNQKLIQKLQVHQEVTPPCVIFFKIADEGFSDISVAALNSPDLIHGLNELCEVVEHYIKNDREGMRTVAVRWISGGAKFLSTETAKIAISRFISSWF